MLEYRIAALLRGNLLCRIIQKYSCKVWMKKNSICALHVDYNTGFDPEVSLLSTSMFNIRHNGIVTRYDSVVIFIQRGD